MEYFPGMEQNRSDDIMVRVLEAIGGCDYSDIGGEDVRAVLCKDSPEVMDFWVLLSPAAGNFLEEMAARAKIEFLRRFGNSVSLFTPLYISNYCVNQCLYCGFNCANKIVRGRLSFEEIERELAEISGTGLNEILILTGESEKESGIEYIGEAVKLSRKYFSAVGIEIYPLNSDKYAYLNECGADFVSVYQETYDPNCYAKNHLRGPKRSYPYRFNAQERAIIGGMRGVGFGALLGLGDFRRDAFGAGIHGYYLQQKYPHAEISFSVPRLRSYINSGGSYSGVSEKELLQIVLAYRIFMPSASVTISTRERAVFRDNVIGLAANRMSAGVSVGVGGRGGEQKGDEQFEIADERSVSEIHDMIVKRGLQPVYNDYTFFL